MKRETDSRKRTRGRMRERTIPRIGETPVQLPGHLYCTKKKKNSNSLLPGNFYESRPYTLKTPISMCVLFFYFFLNYHYKLYC